MREECLREFGFSDVYRLDKERENAVALQVRAWVLFLGSIWGVALCERRCGLHCTASTRSARAQSRCRCVLLLGRVGGGGE